eukprot:4318-Chlamydomonas_euryale.AAC.1
MERLTTDAVTAEVRDVLVDASRRLSSGRDTLLTEFERLDADLDGRLTYAELAEFLRTVMGGRTASKQ